MTAVSLSSLSTSAVDQGSIADNSHAEDEDSDRESVEVAAPASVASALRRGGGRGQKATKKQRIMEEQEYLRHLGSIAESLKEMARQSSLRCMQRNKEIAIIGANGALQFFLEVNDRAKAAEMAMILYHGAKDAASAAQPSLQEVRNTDSHEE